MRILKARLYSSFRQANLFCESFPGKHIRVVRSLKLLLQLMGQFVFVFVFLFVFVFVMIISE